jgi:hypothetical protein
MRESIASIILKIRWKSLSETHLIFSINKILLLLWSQNDSLKILKSERKKTKINNEWCLQKDLIEIDK